MDGLLWALSALALTGTGYWLVRARPWRRVSTSQPKVKVRGIRKYVSPPSVLPRIPVDADTQLPRVILKRQRRIALQRHPRVYHPHHIVERHLHPLYLEKGWRKEGCVYRGYYQVDGRRWRGEIVERHRGFYEAFIYDPPLQHLQCHPHGPCFNRSGVDRFKVHLREMPRSVDHIIVNVETILGEALGYLSGTSEGER